MRQLLALALSFSLPAAAGAGQVKLPAQYAQNLKVPAAEAVSAAAKFLVSAQADLQGPGGSGKLAATWPFEQGTGVAAPNAAGIVARGLLAAGDAGSVAAAKAWGKARLEDFAAGRPAFDPDIEALAALAAATGDAAFLDGAREAFSQRHGGANGREIVERLFIVRKGAPSLVGFDAAATLRAALAVGELAKAREIAEALAATRGRWDVASTAGFDLTGRAAVLEALSGLGAEAPLRAALQKRLTATQGADGSWGVRNTQATAYSVRALLEAGGPEARAAADRGLRFLRTTQLKSGGWATFNDYLPEPFVGETVYEVTAEVMLALSK